MTLPARTWLVLLRDISHAVHIPDEPAIVASLVFDMDTGVVLAASVAATDEQVLEQVCEMALTRPAGDLPPGGPERVLCGPGLVSSLKASLRRLTRPAPLPPVTEVPPVHETEDVFDSFVGHMAGRRDPEEFAGPDDWQLLFDHVLAFYRRQVWARWADDIDLLIEVETGGNVRSFAAVVLGHEGIQHGVVLYPGTGTPTGLRSGPGEHVQSLPAGTLMLNLDPPDELPEEFANKAARYGWPADAELVPLFLTVDGRQPGEPGRDDVQVLAIALAALLEHDATGPVLVGDRPRVTTGELPVASGETAAFTVRVLPRAEAGDPGESLTLRLAGTDLLPLGTPVLLGSTRADGLATLRRSARLHRPLPAGSPPLPKGEMAMLVVIVDDAHGDGLAGRVARLDPFGVSVAEAEGRTAVVLVGGAGAELLMELPAHHPALHKFRSRLKTAKGVHAVLIADKNSSTGGGLVYALFECHLPAEPPSRLRLCSAPVARTKSPRKQS
ncbi:MAG: hypothetical protein M0Z69_10925 [Actinomycetota bacterium]|nr:hypothetical protein [Actinomycetota bacterium]